jgi:hypothetical protein
MKLGFTGSRNEPSKAQRLWLVDYLLEHEVSELHHGCCRGSDAFAHRAAKQCDLKGTIRIVLHPPNKNGWEMTYEQWEYDNCVWWPKADYLDRDRDIVACSDGLIAFPNGPEKLRGSGTWYTVRYAVSKNRPVIICWPDGQIEMRGTP